MAEKKMVSLDDLNKFMNKSSKYGGLVSEGAVSEITDYISTGNYMLNACLTGSIFKGIPNNRSTCLSGVSGVGKTYLALNICREAQKKGYFIIYYDSENAVDKEQFENFGVDIRKVRYEPVQSIQEFRSNLTSTLDYLIEEKDKGSDVPKLLIILDSAGNLATQKEIEDAKTGSEKADFSKAKIMRSVFRIALTKLGILNSTFVFTNHIYEGMSMFPTTIQSGGKGIVYGASLILNMNKGKLKEEGNNQTGVRVYAEPQKNRFCVPTKIEFNISFVRGMNPYIGLENYVSWENCGIERGKFITPKEFDKLPEKDKEKYAKYKVIDSEGTEKYFIQSDTARNICTDSGESYPVRELWSAKVFTEDRLKRIDEVIVKALSYNKNSDSDLDDFVGDVDDVAEVDEELEY